MTKLHQNGFFSSLLLPLGAVPSQHFDFSAVITLYLCVLCHLPLGRLSPTGGHGIFNTRNDLGAYCVHEDETGVDEPAQVLTRKN